MDKFGLYVPQLLPFKEQFLPQAHPACMGCGVALGVRQAYKALEETGGWMEKASWEIPWEQPLPGSLIKSRKEKGETIRPSMLTIEKKNKGHLFICFDNEAVEGKPSKSMFKKRIPDIAVARGFHYVATACPSYPFDLIDKVKRAEACEGPSYLHILCPCPVGWDFDSELTVNIGRFAVECAIFPLYEVVAGDRRLTIDHPGRRPVEQYLNMQKRFSHFKQKDLSEIQAEVDREYAKLRDGKV